MLKLLFNRNSWIVKLLFFVSAVLSLYFFMSVDWQSWTTLQKLALFFFFFQTFFSLGVEKYPWYPKNAPGPGIKLQFHKALVPIAYIWPLFLLIVLNSQPTLLLYFFNIILFPITLTNSLLIALHFKDEDPSPPNYLSGKKH